jgi:hypothetical protein
MPGIAKNSPRTSPELGYVARATAQQADAEAGLRAKQAKAKAMRTQRVQQLAAEASERQRVYDAANHDNVAFMEQYFQCFGPLNALVSLDKYKQTACVAFRELYNQRFGRAQSKEQRDARRAHFNEKFAEHLAQDHQAQVDSYCNTARDGVYAIYAREFPERADPAHFEEYYENAKRAHQMCREAKLPPKFSVDHYVRLFRRMPGDEFAMLLRTGENASPNMCAGAKIVYKERKEELDLVPRNKPFPRAPMQPRAEQVGPNGETSATHDFVTEKHKTGGKGQMVSAGTWVKRQSSSSSAC